MELIFKVFQFLIGAMKVNGYNRHRCINMFQFLIGAMKVDIQRRDDLITGFQFLIGAMKVDMVSAYYATNKDVSIPYRRNESEKAQVAGDAIVLFQFLIGAMKVWESVN